jgi:hypothetical protein
MVCSGVGIEGVYVKEAIGAWLALTEAPCCAKMMKTDKTINKAKARTLTERYFIVSLLPE